MITVFLPVLATTLGCLTEDEGPPKQIQGMWTVREVETDREVVVEGMQLALQQFPGCTWARQTWHFSEDTIRMGYDVLCPGRSTDEHYGCKVSVEAPASWDDASGTWTVSNTARASSRTLALERASLDVPARCHAHIEAGSYPVRRMQNQAWRWEMRVPNGRVLRLALPESDEPDFVSAMRATTNPGGTP
ncbi:MAG: hypothetical protein AAF211_00375 [Myxococcota bacterium]